MSWTNNKSNSRIASEANSLNESTISYRSSILSSNHLPPLNSTAGNSISRTNSAKYENKNSSRLNVGTEDIVKKLEVNSKMLF